MKIGLAAFVVCGVGACGDNLPATLPEVTDAVAYVDPTIGTGGLGFAYGSCFVGAAAPHGLAKPAPDTDGEFGTVAFQHFSGYFSDDNKIQGFSSLHLHGTGATDYGVLSVMPTLAFDPTKTTVVDYEMPFDKSDEHATAGDYRVTLADGTAVELTATQRVAVEKFTLPSAGSLVIDLSKVLDGGTVDAAQLAIDDSAYEITGSLHHLGGMSSGYGGYTVYFVARAAQPWTSHYAWAKGSPADANATSAQGTAVGAAIGLPAGEFQLAIGLSLVSAEGARKNLDSEVPTIDVDVVAAETRAAWGDKLDRVELTGGTLAQRRTFYTSLYHAFLMPSVIGDVDGTYQLVGQPAQVASGWHQMSDLSLWDTYRTVAPLYAWLAPESAHDAARSLVGFGDGLGAYPKWPLAIGETGTMLGASAEIILADATARGVADAGGDLAYPQLRAAAMDPDAPAASRGGRSDVVPYMTYGYVPRSISSSVSETTEYSHDDFALGQLAGALGHTADHDALLARSLGWRLLYDPSVGYLRGRNEDGTFPTDPFDPGAMSDDYREANARQSLWMTGLHDPDGLAQLLGGNDAAVATLSDLFAQTKIDAETSDPSAANFPRPYYWAGNEPDLNAAFLFAQWGRPDLTAQWTRWVLDTIYTDQPDGVPGNDDGGTMGAWYVLASIGLYPVAGTDTWVIGTPSFPRVRIDVGGHELVIEADGVGDAPAYVHNIEIDGANIAGPYLTQAQLAGASRITFTMTQNP